MATINEGKRKGKKKRAQGVTDTTLLPPSSVTSSPRVDVLRAALVSSLSGQSLEDVKFFVFSRRMRTGFVDTPLPLLANSSLIRKASPHFAFLELGTGFAESTISDLEDPYPSTRSDSLQSYDYQSDSDLEDEEDPEEAVEHTAHGSTSDSSLSTNLGGKPEGLLNGGEEIKRDDTNGEGAAEKKQVIIRKPGRVVFLDDIAYTTWKAFLFWAYLEEINFAPLRSQQQPPPKSEGQPGPPPCSPKSMYRIAHKYDIPSLKEMAVDDIQTKLSPFNILEEIFSTFTSLYPEIQAIELEYLCSNVKDPGIQARLPTWLDDMENGRLPEGAAATVASLIAKLISPQATPVPAAKRCPYSCNSTVSNYCNSCRNTFN